MSRPPKYTEEDINSHLETFCCENEKLSSTKFEKEDKFCGLKSVYRIYDSWEEALNSVQEQTWRNKVQFSREDLKQSAIDFYEENEMISQSSYLNNSEYPNTNTIRNHFDSWPEFLSHALEEKPSSLTECRECGGYIESPSMHWRGSECSYPEIPQKLQNILEGILMGDGTVSKPEYGTSSFEINMISREYLEWLSNEYPFLFGNVYLAKPAQEMEVKGEKYDCRDLWSVTAYHHPFFKDMREKWYSDSEKSFPDDLELTPEKLRHWYVTDGGLRWNKDRLKGTCLYSENECHRPEYILSLFERLGFDCYNTDKNKFVIKTVDSFFEYIGEEAVPGFEYKWEVDNRDKYNNLKSEAYGNIRREKRET